MIRKETMKNLIRRSRNSEKTGEERGEKEKNSLGMGKKKKHGKSCHPIIYSHVSAPNTPKNTLNKVRTLVYYTILI